MGWKELLILAVVAAVLCMEWFYRYVYFMSVGYGLAVAGIGVALIRMFRESLQPVQIVLCLLMMVYGFRLSGFLIVRELKETAYQKTLQEATSNEKGMPAGVKAAIWIGVTVLYVAQTSPVFYRMYNDAPQNAAAWIGAGICIIAIILESLADKQKGEQKKKNPDMVATKGLYRMVRCPNYFGEILFWTGLFISGFGALAGFGQWLMAAAGYVCIVMVMFNGAQRLEKRQNGRYGEKKEYQEYVSRTPILIPLIPLYHLNSQKKK